METKFEILKPFVTIPKCNFGTAVGSRHACSPIWEKLFNELNKIGAVWFVRSGTELGVVRKSELLEVDGDIDIFVDIPTKKLYNKIKHLGVHVSDKEVHLSTAICPEIHTCMVYSDWMLNQMYSEATHQDICSCMMNNIETHCHKKAPDRMYNQYEPSWEIPLGIKALDMPYWAKTNSKQVTRMKAKN